MNRIEAYEVIERWLVFYHRHMDNGPEEVELGNAIEVFGQDLRAMWTEDHAKHFIRIIKNPVGQHPDGKARNAHPDTPWLWSCKHVELEGYEVDVNTGVVSVKVSWWAGDETGYHTYAVPLYVLDQAREHPERVQAWLEGLWEKKDAQDADMQAAAKRREIEQAAETLRKHGINPGV